MFAGGSAFPHYYDFDLEYSQRTDVPVAPAPEQQLSFNRNDGNDGLGVGLGVEAGIKHRVADDIDLTVSGFADWMSDAAGADTKISPTDDATHVDSDERVTYGARFKVRLAF